jgi:tryptophan synthase alpha chain
MVDVSTRIGHLFLRKKEAGRKAFVAYLTGGDPSLTHTAFLILALERGGADLIELGVPFSDPIADGPVIQRASERALQAGTNLRGLLNVIRDVRKSSEIPILLFSYLNPVLRYGFDKLAKDAVEAGIDGVLLTDLCVEEAEEPVKKLRAQGLDTVFLVAPTSTQKRLELVAAHSSGFIYMVSRTGVTGEQQSLSEAVAPLAHQMRTLASLPLVVGFGIGTPAQVADAAKLVDGVVVGSAIVRFIESHAKDADLALELERFTKELSAPLRHS